MAINKKKADIKYTNFIEMSVPFIGSLFEGKLVYYDGTEINVEDLEPHDCYFLYRQLEENAVELKDALENSWYYDRAGTRPYFNLAKKKLRTTIGGLLEMSPKEFIERCKIYKLAKTRYMKSKYQY